MIHESTGSEQSGEVNTRISSIDLRIHICTRETAFAFIYAPEKNAPNIGEYAESRIPRTFEMPITR